MQPTKPPMMSFVSSVPDTFRYSFAEAILSLQPLLDAEAILFITDRLHVHRKEKNTVLMPLGTVCDKLYFLHSGLARGYYAENDKEITAWFAKENDFIYSPTGFLNQKPALEAVEVLEDSALVSLAYEDLRQLYDLFPMTNNIGRLITENRLLFYDEWVRSLRSLSAEERFRKFVADYPTIYERAPLKHIASFLGMSPETVSRILKRKN
jgi:CRP-like cAMP-binding protein